MIPIWYPSLLAADPLQLFKGLEKIKQARISNIHLDVMDGHFVPNITFGPYVVAAVKRHAPQLFRDVHLMLSHPENFIPAFVKNGAQRIFIHLEIEQKSLEKSIELLVNSGIPWGFAINPETDWHQLQQHTILEKTSCLLVMSVYPGFSGQTFIPITFERARGLRKTFPTLELCIDGGINEVIASRFLEEGVSHFVIGSNFFG